MQDHSSVLFLRIWFVLFANIFKLINSELKPYEATYVFKPDTINAKEDGFVYANKYNIINMTYNGAYTKSPCKCVEYHYYQYTTCFDPYICTDFPKDIEFQYKKLRIGTTKIIELKMGDLGLKNRHLEIFMIDGNMEFMEIQPGAFYNMSQLKNISISHNPKLTHLHADAFKGCDNLDVLVLIENGFSTFSDFTIGLSPRIMPQLRKLQVVGLFVNSIMAKDFAAMNGTSLRILNINSCNVKFIDPDILPILVNLEVIRLIENNISNANILDFIKKIAALKMNVDKFSLSGFNYIPISANILTAIAATKIRHLSLCCTNKFDVISEFPRMDRITYLDLNNVNAINISQNAFEKLTNLEILLLSQNKLKSIPTAALLPSIKILDVSDNTAIENYFFKLNANAFVKMKKLEYLNISINNIRTIDECFFRGLENLRTLDLQYTKIAVAKNGTFRDLKKLEYLNLHANYFPAVMMYPEIFTGLGNLLVLIMSNCGIEHINSANNIFIETPLLKYLILGKNRMKIINGDIFRTIKYLEFIDLSGNLLKAWDLRLFVHNNNIKVIDLEENMFSTITESMVYDFEYLENIDLRNNRFSCTCDLYKNMTNNMITYLEKLLNDTSPICASPEDFVNDPIITFIKEVAATNKCENRSTRIDQNILIILIIAMFLFVSLSGCFLLYLYRLYVNRYFSWVMLAITNNELNTQEFLKTKRSYKYDVLVSYCEENQHFANHLIRILEDRRPYMKLCVYERDFQIATVISKSVLESVADSRRTLLVISDAYIRSQWCRWEVQVAENHQLFFEDENGKCVNDAFIIIKIGEISAIISPMLRYLMSTQIYLEWDEDVKKQKLFWKKLRQFLQPHKKTFKY